MIEATVTVSPAGGLVITIEAGTPPFEVYAGEVLLAKTDEYLIFLPADITRNIQTVPLKIKDSTGYERFLEIGQPNLNPYEIGFIRTILKHNLVLIQRRGGFLVKVLKRRHWGTPCPVCRKEIGPPEELAAVINQELSASGDCPVCFGTGYQGGYHPPIEVWATYYNKEPVIMDSADVVRFEQITLLLPNYPKVSKDDLLVIPTFGNQIVRILQVQPTTYKGVTISQVVAGQTVPEGSALNKLANLQTLEVEEEANLGFTDTLNS
jgi:hypothetical protein